MNYFTDLVRLRFPGRRISRMKRGVVVVVENQ